MKQIILVILSVVGLIGGCTSIEVPNEYSYQIIQTKYFDIASWQKISSPNSVYKIYIEGDGHAFNARGLPTSDPTPKGTLVRQLAFGDKNANVIYLARPCQYAQNHLCKQKYWTTARFSKEVIDSEYEAIKSLVGNHDVILVGFSGGGLVAGLIAATKNDIKVKKIITIAGNLDHQAWTEYHHLPMLSGSLNLEDFKAQFAQIPQIHYVGEKDTIVPASITEQFINNDNLLVKLPNVSHADGWESIYPNIWSEK